MSKGADRRRKTIRQEATLGALWASSEEFLDVLVEIAGYKAGVVLSHEEVSGLVEGTQFFEDIIESGRGGGRVRSEVFEEAVVRLLYRLGNTPTDSIVSASIESYHKYKGNARDLKTYQGVQELWIEIWPKLIDETPHGGMIDPSEFMMAAVAKHGQRGLDMAMEILTGIDRDLHRSAWGHIRSYEWKNEVELKSLFESESLETMHGRFLDQRFIDYLYRNFERIDEIHWRKFEGLAGEFFDREGFAVEMGPGRNDNGIDLRIFPKADRDDAPPLIIVQCKRVKAKIDKALVKSVYADVLHEKAGSGLIVTTSSLSRGADELRLARNYPVEAADRPHLREWIEKMRSAR